MSLEGGCRSRVYCLDTKRCLTRSLDYTKEDGMSVFRLMICDGGYVIHRNIDLCLPPYHSEEYLLHFN